MLGPLRVVADGAVVTLRGPRRRALLARLAATGGRVVATDVLIDDVWEDLPPGSPRQTLQSHISHLRRELSDVGVRVLADVDGYRLDITPRHVDSHVFEDAVRRAAHADDPEERSAALAEALALWRGPALQGLEHAWARGEAARLEELRLKAVEDRIAAEMAQGRHRDVVAELRGLVASHPLREGMWAQLMVALSATGRHAEALRAGQDLRRRLADLGLEPGGELAQLEAGIARHERSVVGPAAGRDARPAQRAAGRGSEVAGDVTDRPPFVGRDAALARLEGLRGEGRRVEVRAAVVSGTPGVGKSRLIDEAAARAEARGALVLAGRCEEDVATPLGPVVEMAARALVGRSGSGAPRAAERGWDALRPAAAASVDAVALDIEWDRYFCDITAWLAIEATSRPLVLVIDDLHCADTATLRLLRHLLHRRDLALTILMTCRTGGRGEVVGADRLVFDVLSAEAVTHVRIGPLTEVETAELVRSWPVARALASDDLDEAAKALWRRSGGNPLLLRELMLDLVESGARGVPPETDAPGALTVSHRIRTIVDKRLSRLGPRTARLLEQAAVLGVEVDVSVLRTAAEVDDVGLADALDEATSAHVLERIEPTARGYRFTHGLLCDGLHSRIPPARRALLHRSAALALERVVGVGDPERLAYHWTEAAVLGDVGPAVAYSRAAGLAALACGTPELAVRHLLTARRLDESAGSSTADRAELLLELGEAQRARQDPRHRATFLDAATQARVDEDPLRLARAAKGICRGFVVLGGPSDEERLAVVREAVGALPAGDVGPLGPQLLAGLAGELRIAGRDRESEAVMNRAVALAREHRDPAVVVNALATQWDLLFQPSTLRARTTIAEQITEVAASALAAGARPEIAVRAGWVAFGTALERDDEPRARAALRVLDDASTQSSDPRLLWRCAAARATWAAATDAPDAGALIGAAAGVGAELGWGEVVATQAAQSILLGIRHDVQGILSTLAPAPAPEMLTALPAGRAAHLLRLAVEGRHDMVATGVAQFVVEGRLVLPRDATRPCAVVLLAWIARVLGHEELATAVLGELRSVVGPALAHPSHYAGRVEAIRSIVAAAG